MVSEGRDEFAGMRTFYLYVNDVDAFACHAIDVIAYLYLNPLICHIVTNNRSDRSGLVITGGFPPTGRKNYHD